MTAATVVQQLCKSCGTCFKFYCMFFYCDRSLTYVCVTKLNRSASATTYATSTDVRCPSIVQHDAAVSTEFTAVGPAASQTPFRRASTPLPQVLGGDGQPRRGRVHLHRHGVVIAGQDRDAPGGYRAGV